MAAITNKKIVRALMVAVVGTGLLLGLFTPATAADPSAKLLAKGKVDAPDRPNTVYQDLLQKEMDRVMGKIGVILDEANVSNDEKKLKIVEFLRSYRYGDDNRETFFISDIRGTLILNPLEPEKEGKDLRAMQDANGKLFFAEFIRVALQNGSGFVDYMYSDAEGSAPKPKVALVKLLKDLGWVIGTGLVREIVAAYEVPVYYVPLPIINDRQPPSPT